MSFWRWSKTAGNNDDIDPAINWREGMGASAYNNSARAMMAVLAKKAEDDSGLLVTTGTASAYVITSNQNISTLTDGASVSARVHVTNGASPTLAVDGTAAKAITIAPGVPPSAGMLIAGSIQTFTRIAADDEWRLSNIVVPDGVAQTGAKMDSILPGPHAGWVLAAGGTIGNASSGGTERAHADTQPLYIGWHKGTASQNALYPIQDSSGSSSTRTTGGTADENALADYNANKRLPLPDLSGRGFSGLDNMSGTPRNVVTNAAADILGGTHGAATHTLQASEGPIHSHDITQTPHGHTGSVAAVVLTGGGAGGLGVSGAYVGQVPSLNINPANANITINNAGSGVAHNNMQPTFFGYVFIKL